MPARRKYKTEKERKVAELAAKKYRRDELRALESEERATLYHIRYTDRISGVARTVGPYSGQYIEGKVVLLHHSETVIPGTIEVLGGECYA